MYNLNTNEDHCHSANSTKHKMDDPQRDWQDEALSVMNQKGANGVLVSLSPRLEGEYHHMVSFSRASADSSTLKFHDRDHVSPDYHTPVGGEPPEFSRYTIVPVLRSAPQSLQQFKFDHTPLL